VVDVVEPRAGLVQAIADGVVRKRSIVLLAGEAFLLGGRHGMAVLDQRSRAVVIKRRYAEHPHRYAS
jgi:hypothetical protein